MDEDIEPGVPDDPNFPPPEIGDLVRQRAEARARQDWTTADSLKAQIEKAGWSIVDRGSRSTLRRTSPMSVEVDGELRYGSAADVPLADATDARWTVAIVAGETPDFISRLLSGLRAHAPSGTQVVVVLNDPSAAQAAALSPGAPDREPIGGREVELLRTAVRLGHAAALNIALRRASGELVLLADGSAVPTGDALTPLADALSDGQVAVAGAFGIVSTEPGGLRPGALERSTTCDVGALTWGWLAFRRRESIELGPVDERFVSPAWLDIWLSLRLRAGAEPDWAEQTDEPAAEQAAGQSADGTPDDEPTFAAPEAPDGSVLPAPRRAIRLDLALEGEGQPWPPERTRLNRRNMYRVLRRFGWRPDLF